MTTATEFQATTAAALHLGGGGTSARVSLSSILSFFVFSLSTSNSLSLFLSAAARRHSLPLVGAT
ncbi:hypothetical protein PIB30_104032, partial [Stylosanthes scabra]|nr:hypothetical protein [Stylosanthes scabra]